MDRFPEDFMFQLTELEWENLMSQFATSSPPTGRAGWGGRRKLPFAFTEKDILLKLEKLEGKVSKHDDNFLR